jgi:hypothetical protein
LGAVTTRPQLGLQYPMPEDRCAQHDVLPRWKCLQQWLLGKFFGGKLRRSRCCNAAFPLGQRRRIMPSRAAPWIITIIIIIILIIIISVADFLTLSLLDQINLRVYLIACFRNPTNTVHAHHSFRFFPSSKNPNRASLRPRSCPRIKEPITGSCRTLLRESW